MDDLIIIGAGPAGLTASIYASCFHLKHKIIGQALGGQLQFAPDILNYPGFSEISGKELTEKMVDQVKTLGGEIILQNVTSIVLKEDFFEIETSEKQKYKAKSLIIATGTERRKLNVAGEKEYLGKGIYYCVSCGKQDYQDKVCAVIGGGNSALQAAVELIQVAAKVYLLYRGSELRGDPIWMEQVKKNPKIEVFYQTVVKEIKGDKTKITGVQIEKADSATKDVKSSFLSVERLFIAIGGIPGTALVSPLGVVMDQGGYIKVDEQLATNIGGIFAAGDLVSGELSIEQISTAVGLGARAAVSAFTYLKKEKAPTVWGESQIKR